MKRRTHVWMVEDDVSGSQTVFLSEARARDYLQSTLETFGEPTWHETSTGWAVIVEDDGAGHWSGAIYSVEADLSE